MFGVVALTQIDPAGTLRTVEGLSANLNAGTCVCGVICKAGAKYVPAVNPTLVTVVPEITILTPVENNCNKLFGEPAVTPAMPAVLIAVTSPAKLVTPVTGVPLIVMVSPINNVMLLL